jgi:septal ring factor EnvC (AmiA/AmiB activator)
MEKLDLAIKKSEEALKDLNARIGELLEALDAVKTQRDSEFSVLQALVFAKKIVENQD